MALVCGLSGRHQSARHSPSMSQGNGHTAVDTIMPLLKKWAPLPLGLARAVCFPLLPMPLHCEL